VPSISVGETTTASASAPAPIFTVAPLAKPAPVICTAVPPATGPWAGETALTVGLAPVVPLDPLEPPEPAAPLDPLEPPSAAVLPPLHPAAAATQAKSTVQRAMFMSFSRGGRL